MPAMLSFRVGWRAYKHDAQGQPMLIAIGKDVFQAQNAEGAMKRALRRVPFSISAPDAEIGIRYVRQL